MSKPIEELRAQRELIQRHLNWLDAQIQRAESEDTYSPSGSTEEPSEVATRKSNSLQQPAGKTVQSVAKASPENPVEARFMQSSNASDIKRIQIGCFLLFATATLLFLFLLFGLPYLLD